MNELKLEIGLKVEITLKKPYEPKPGFFNNFFNKLVCLTRQLKDEEEIEDDEILTESDDNLSVEDENEISEEESDNIEPKLYFSKILDIKKNDIILYPPMAKMMTLALCEGDIIGIHYVVIQKGRYISDAEVISIEENSITVRLLGEEIRIQEREYYRVNVFEVVEAMILQVKKTEVQIYDISYTGAKIRIKEEDILHINDILLIQIPQGTGRFVSTEVVREAGEHVYGIRFIDLTDEEKNRLERYIMEKDRQKSGRVNNRIL